MINLERLTKFNIEDRLKALRENYIDRESFFGNIMVLDALLNHMNKELYIVYNNEESYLIMLKERKNEYRFLFAEPTREFLSEFHKQFQPAYIGANLLPKSSLSKKEINGSEEELILNVNKILNLEDSSFRKHYARSIKYESELNTLPFSYKEDIPDLLEFLENWRFVRSEKLNRFANIENDLNFLAIYGNKPFVKGVVVRDNVKIVGYCLFIPQTEKACISVFSKILRDYENLGVFLTFKKCKYMKESGFEEAYLGTINNSFKRSLEWAGHIKKIYSTELYRFSKMKIRSTLEEYSNLILS